MVENMTLTIGDHLLISRNGQLVDSKSEGYVEYEVVEIPKYESVLGSGMRQMVFVTVRLKVIK